MTGSACDGCGMTYGILETIRIAWRTPASEGAPEGWFREHCHRVTYHMGEPGCLESAVRKKRREVFARV